MAVDYSKIKSKKLVELLKNSPALDFLNKEDQQKYVDRVVSLSDKGEKDLVKLLEKQEKTVPKLTLKEKIAVFEAGTKALKNMMRKFDKDVRVEEEKVDKKESEKAQGHLLSELNNL